MEDSGETRANSSENFSKERRCRRGGKVADRKRVLVRQEKWDPLFRDFGDFDTGPDPASAGGRVQLPIRLGQLRIVGHGP